MSTKEEKRIAAWEQQLKLDRDALLKVPGFCRVVRNMLDTHGMFRSSFAGENTHSTAFNEGARNVALRLTAELEDANPNALALLHAHAMPNPTDKDQSDE